jgi:glutamate-ammonia-ligase adenylyltransferase
MTLRDRLQPALVPFDAALANQKFAALQKLLPGEAALTHGAVEALLRGVFGCSPYLTALIFRDPGEAMACLAADPASRLRDILQTLDADMAAVRSHAEAVRALRWAKNRVALLSAFCDLGGAWTVEETTAALTEAADTLTQAAARFLLREAKASGRLLGGGGYIVLGMGKYGAHELNYSSDIDLIVFYDADAVALPPGAEPGPLFVRLTRDLVKLLNERTADGYVYRTDLRLRPDPGSTQIALSTDAAFHYYESAGQNWERAAYIKARAVAGDIAAGEGFLRELSPYVWRKYLDYAAIADIHAMKRQIHAFKGHGAVAVAGHNLKLGRGGIREIEFFVQTQQLIAGGRQPDLRVRGTLEALQRLAARGWISAEAAGELSAAYRFLRTIEHCLQMVNDEQTHTLPGDADGLRRIANFSGFADADGFAAALTAHLECVQGHYARLFESVPELTSARREGSLVFTGAGDDPATLATLKAMGFSYPASVVSTVQGWHFGRYPAMRSARARERLTEVTPALLDALSQTANPDQALASFDAFMAELPAGVQLFALLRNNPGLLRLLADIMGSAPRLARALSKSRRVLDAVLDPGLLMEQIDPASMRAFLANDIAAASDYEDALNRARIVGREQAFLIGVRLLSGALSADKAGEAYTALADGLIAALQSQVEALMRQTHGEIPGGQAAIIGMGKLGGREMTASSDLDLIVVYDYAPGAVSTGLKPLPAGLYYTRYTQRLISALSAQTAEGALYEVDMRLRPSGNAGPVATSLAAFSEYQEKSAWTWEHMALTRARVVSGPPELAETLGGVIRAALTKDRDSAKIRADVRDMRARIAAHKGAKSIWDIKQARGGLVDVEFIAQCLQLLNAGHEPSVLRQNTAEALSALRDAGALTPDAASALINAATFSNALTQILRLCVEGQFTPATAPVGVKQRLAKAVGAPDFERVEAELADRQGEVARLFDEIIPA